MGLYEIFEGVKSDGLDIKQPFVATDMGLNAVFATKAISFAAILEREEEGEGGV